jgi:hypothetical protein
MICSNGLDLAIGQDQIGLSEVGSTLPSLPSDFNVFQSRFNMG